MKMDIIIISSLIHSVLVNMSEKHCLWKSFINKKELFWYDDDFYYLFDFLVNLKFQELR